MSVVLVIVEVALAAVVLFAVVAGKRRKQPALSDEAIRTLQAALTEWDNALITTARRGGRPVGAGDDPRAWPRYRWPATVVRINAARAELSALPSGWRLADRREARATRKVK